MSFAKRLILTLATIVGSSSTFAATSPTYSILRLQTPNEAPVMPRDLNSYGQVVGSSHYNPGVEWQIGGDFHAVVTGKNGYPTIDLDTFGPRAVAINDSGLVVINSDDAAPYESFVLDPATQQLRQLSTKWNKYVSAAAINNHGVVAATASYANYYEVAAPTNRAFSFAPDGTATYLGVFASDVYRIEETYAKDINDNGDIVGYAIVTTLQYGGPYGRIRPFAWSAQTGEMINLDSLGGAYSYATAVNNNGEVVGYSDLLESSLPYHAFIVDVSGDGMRDLGTLNGYYSSRAEDINDLSIVVGSYRATDNSHSRAFISDAGATELMDLTDLVFPEGDGLIFENAVSINNRGQIIARSSYSSYYLLSPVPEPSVSLMLATGIAMVGALSKRKMKQRRESGLETSGG